MTVDSQKAPPPQPPEFCVFCGNQFKEGAVFCEKCGAVRQSVRYVPPIHQLDWRTYALNPIQYRPVVKSASWRVLFKTLFAVAMITVLIELVASLITLVYGIGMVSDYINSTPEGFSLFLVIPVFIDVLTLTGNSWLAYYLFLVGAIVASCTWVLLTSYKGFAKELTMKAKSREHSQIFDISGLIFVNIFVSLVILILAILLGASDTSAPGQGSLSENLFLLANAAVWEELIVRVLLIGIPLVIVDVVRRKFKKRWYAYVLGGGFEFGIPEVVLVIASATIFGFAHWLGGWGAWKIPAAGFGGIAFGYLFLKFGLPAAVVMHFAIDYSSMPTEVFGVSPLLEGVLFLFWLGLGFIFFIYYVIRVGEFLTGAKYLEEKPRYFGVPVPQPWMYYSPQSVPPQPYPQTQPPPTIPNATVPPPPSSPPQYGFQGGYVCPYCGHTEARWVNGRFQCMYCGRLT